jgi:hypothetical protein
MMWKPLLASVAFSCFVLAGCASSADVRASEAREAAAVERIVRATGRDVPIDIDGSLLDGTSEDEARARARIVSDLAGAIAHWTREPAMADLFRRRVRRIRVDEAKGGAGALEPDGTLAGSSTEAMGSALRAALGEELLARFRGRTLAEVGDPELPLYLAAVDYLIPYVAKTPREVQLEALARLRLLLAIEQRARSTPLGERVEDTLLARIDWLAQPNLVSDQETARAGAEVAALLRPWLDARLLRMPEERRLSLVLALMGQDMNCQVTPCHPVPELDHRRLAIELLASARTPEGQAALGEKAVRYLACPFDPRGDARMPNPEVACDQLLVEVLGRDEAGRAQLAAFLARGVDDGFMASALAAVDRKGPLALLRALVAHPSTLGQAVRVSVQDRTLRHEPAWAIAQEAWNTAPAARGSLLLAMADRYANQSGGYPPSHAWARFHQDFGMRVDAPLLQSMLREGGDLAVELVPTMWSGLGAIRQPMAIVEPYLDAYLDRSASTARRAVVEPLAEALCASKDRDGLARLTGLLTRRAGAGKPVPALTRRIDGCGS